MINPLKITSLLFIALSLNLGLVAQDVKPFSLKEAQIYALEHNYDVINAMTDIEIARKKIAETISTGLPQINGQLKYDDYVQIPTQLIPGEFFGQAPGTFSELQFGTQHNVNASASISQMIFNGQYLVGLQASRAFLSLSETSLEKSQIEIKDLIAKAYYPVVILQENLIVFDSTLASLDKMLYETQQYQQAGFLEDTDVDQLELLISNMKATLTNIANQLDISRNTLKFLMGLKSEDRIVVTDKLDDLMTSVNKQFLLDSPFDESNHIDFKMLMNQEEIAYLDLKLKRSAYYPMVNASYVYLQNAQRNQFNFFKSGESWFPTQILAVQVDIPIFSSGNRKYKVQQAKLEIQKVKVQEEQLKQSLSLKVNTAKADFNNSYLIYLNKQMGLKNSGRIYEKTKVKYKEGLSTSLEFSQTYNQYLNAQIEFLTANMDLLIKKSNLEKELTKVNY